EHAAQRAHVALVAKAQEQSVELRVTHRASPLHGGDRRYDNSARTAHSARHDGRALDRTLPRSLPRVIADDRRHAIAACAPLARCATLPHHGGHGLMLIQSFVCLSLLTLCADRITGKSF